MCSLSLVVGDIINALMLQLCNLQPHQAGTSVDKYKVFILFLRCGEGPHRSSNRQPRNAPLEQHNFLDGQLYTITLLSSIIKDVTQPLVYCLCCATYMNIRFQ